MNPNNNQPQQPNGSIPEWFNAAATPAPQAPKPSIHTSKRIIIIAATAAVIIASVGVIAFLLSANSSSCLTSTDYKDLTGVSLASAPSPTDSFYTEYVLFNDGTSKYDDSSDDGAHGGGLINKIASFYKDHPKKSIIITVSASYFAAAGESLANERVTAVQSSLVAAGIPSGAIVVQGASLIEPEDAIEGDESNGETTIAITSDPTCR